MEFSNTTTIYFVLQKTYLRSHSTSFSSEVKNSSTSLSRQNNLTSPSKQIPQTHLRAHVYISFLIARPLCFQQISIMSHEGQQNVFKTNLNFTTSRNENKIQSKKTFFWVEITKKTENFTILNIKNETLTKFN